MGTMEIDRFSNTAATLAVDGSRSAPRDGQREQEDPDEHRHQREDAAGQALGHVVPVPAHAAVSAGFRSCLRCKGWQFVRGRKAVTHSSTHLSS